MDDVTELVSRALDTSVTAVQSVGGGDVAQAHRLTLDDGKTVFAKMRPGAPADFFETEAIGLRWLRDGSAVSIPDVLHVGFDPPILVLEWITSGEPTADSESELGRALANLHRAGSPCFGREDRRPTGSRQLPNEPCDTWAEFYAVNRLLPLAKLAGDLEVLPAQTVTDLESIAARLDELGGPPEPPARLHGDLWAGNRMIGPGGISWLIDPAAHGGHREFDLAMMRLFGGYGADCFAAYDEAAPLADGWQQRVELHQLAPLAVHSIKFGGGYVSATSHAAARFK